MENTLIIRTLASVTEDEASQGLLLQYLSANSANKACIPLCYRGSLVPPVPLRTLEFVLSCADLQSLMGPEQAVPSSVTALRERYQSERRRLKKVFFDPFCRQGSKGAGLVKVKVDLPPLLLQSSIGQLLFFSWALRPEQRAQLHELMMFATDYKIPLARAKVRRAKLTKLRMQLPDPSLPQHPPPSPPVVAPQPPQPESQKVSLRMATGIFAAIFSCGKGSSTVAINSVSPLQAAPPVASPRPLPLPSSSPSPPRARAPAPAPTPGKTLDSRALRKLDKRVKMGRHFNDDYSLCERRSRGNRAGRYNCVRFSIPLAKALACSETIRSQQGGVIPVQRKEVSSIRAVM